MSREARILVVDSDYDTLHQLATALRDRGHHVTLATEGRSGLSHAVETSAEAVIVSQDLRVIDVRTFIDVLRENPRTRGAQLFVMGDGSPNHLTAIEGRARPIVKPFNVTQVCARVEEVLARGKSEAPPPEDSEMRGDLAQVAIFDLLQVFAANRRTGCLRVIGQSLRGEIWLVDGEVYDATQRHSVGLKAVYRLLALTEGRFVFRPESKPPLRRIHASGDAILMESARRSDEMRALLDALPPLSSTLSLATPPAQVGRVGATILAALDEPRTMAELLDAVDAFDLEALQSIKALLDENAILVFDAQGRTPFGEPEERGALKAAIRRLQRAGVAGPPRLGVVADRAANLDRFQRALEAVTDIELPETAPTAAGDGYFGLLGTLVLGEDRLELYAVPGDLALRPLWGLALAPSVALMCLGEPTPRDEDEAFARLHDVRLVHVPFGYGRPIGAIAAIREALGAAR